MREMQRVEPGLVAQMRFVEWTAEGRLACRIPRFALRPERARGAAGSELRPCLRPQFCQKRTLAARDNDMPAHLARNLCVRPTASGFAY